MICSIWGIEKWCLSRFWRFFENSIPKFETIYHWDLKVRYAEKGHKKRWLWKAASSSSGSKQLQNLTWEDNLFIAARWVKSRCHKNTFHTGSLCSVPYFFSFLAEDSFPQFFLLDSIFLAWLIFELTHIYLLSARLWPLFVAMYSFYLCSDRLLQFVSRLMLHFLLLPQHLKSWENLLNWCNRRCYYQ